MVAAAVSWRRYPGSVSLPFPGRFRRAAAHTGSHLGEVYGHCDAEGIWLGLIGEHVKPRVPVAESVAITGPAGSVLLTSCAIVHKIACDLRQGMTGWERSRGGCSRVGWWSGRWPIPLGVHSGVELAVPSAPARFPDMD